MSKLLDRKFLILMTFLLICCMSFSAITGAKYLGTLITVFEDFFGDVKKVLVAGAVIFVAVKAVQAAAGSDANGFVVTLFMVLFIIALAGIFLTLAVAVGGATVNDEVLEQMKNQTVIEKNIEVLYEIE